MARKNIAVVAQFTADGVVTPQAIVWEDGRRFEIDRVINVCKCVSLKAGGIGSRFLCRIRNKEIHLFKEDERWFIEI